jgi:ribosomal protein L11 methyltransferase
MAVFSSVCDGRSAAIDIERAAMGAFLSVRCWVPLALEEEIPTLLYPMPVLGTEIGERRDGRVEVTVFLPHTERGMAVDVTTLLATAGAGAIKVSTVEEEDWLARYRRDVQPFAVGETWWVDPHPETPTQAPPGRRRLVMPPRMAFGSGSHESTRLILCALEMADLKGRCVLDVGTGSGVLALAADLLGARRVLGVDIDAIAVDIARQIGDLQEWRPSVHYVVGSADCAAGCLFDFVLCNMIAAHFLPLLDLLAATLAPQGTLVLSGLLVGEEGDVAAELWKRNLVAGPAAVLNEWASLSAGRRV